MFERCCTVFRVIQDHFKAISNGEDKERKITCLRLSLSRNNKFKPKDNHMVGPTFKSYSVRLYSLCFNFSCFCPLGNYKFIFFSKTY